jgi:hypothetical protein
MPTPRRQLRTASLQDALVEAEEAIVDTLARLRDAADDERSEAEGSGEADCQRRAWFPVYHAA